MNVDVFIPCELDQFYPETGKNMICLLQQVGCTVHYHPEQTCCGRMAFEWGDWKTAKKIGEKFITTFSGNQPIVFPSITCLSFICQHYKKIFHNTAFHIEYQQLSSVIVEFTDFAFHQLHVTDFGASFPHQVLLIDSANHNEAAFQLLSKVNGLTLIEHPDPSQFNVGRDISLTNESIASQIAKHALMKALDSGAEWITSTDLELLHYFDQQIKKEGLPLQTIPVINILSSKIASCSQTKN